MLSVSHEQLVHQLNGSTSPGSRRLGRYAVRVGAWQAGHGSAGRSIAVSFRGNGKAPRGRLAGLRGAGLVAVDGGADEGHPADWHDVLGLKLSDQLTNGIHPGGEGFDVAPDSVEVLLHFRVLFDGLVNTGRPFEVGFTGFHRFLLLLLGSSGMGTFCCTSTTGWGRARWLNWRSEERRVGTEGG